MHWLRLWKAVWDIDQSNSIVSMNSGQILKNESRVPKSVPSEAL